MKFVFAVLLLAGLALAEPESTPEAEADPAADAWYGYYGRGHGYGGYGGYGYGHGGYGGYYGNRGYGYGGYYRGKRDAEAEADPAVLASSSALTAPQALGYGIHHPYAAAYGYGLPYAGHHAVPHAYTVSAPAVTHTVPAVTYTHPTAAYGYGLPYAGHHAGVYGGYGGYPHAYGGLYGYGLPVVAPAAEAERKKRDADPEATPEADPEAEAAADAWYGYYGRPSYYGGHYGRGYGGYGGYYGRGYGGYGGYYGGYGGYGYGK